MCPWSGERHLVYRVLTKSLENGVTDGCTIDCLVCGHSTTRKSTFQLLWAKRE